MYAAKDEMGGQAEKTLIPVARISLSYSAYVSKPEQAVRAGIRVLFLRSALSATYTGLQDMLCGAAVDTATLASTHPRLSIRTFVSRSPSVSVLTCQRRWVRVVGLPRVWLALMLL